MIKEKITLKNLLYGLLNTLGMIWCLIWFLMTSFIIIQFIINPIYIIKDIYFTKDDLKEEFL